MSFVRKLSNYLCRRCTSRRVEQLEAQFESAKEKIKILKVKLEEQKEKTRDLYKRNQEYAERINAARKD